MGAEVRRFAHVRRYCGAHRACSASHRACTAVRLPQRHFRMRIRTARRTKPAGKTKHAERTQNTRHTQKSCNTQHARVTKYEVRVSCVSASWRSAKSSSWTDFGSWPSLMGAMQAVRRIRRVRFCMHLRMAVDSVMKPNFAALGSYLELQRASSRSAY